MHWENDQPLMLNETKDRFESKEVGLHPKCGYGSVLADFVYLLTKSVVLLLILYCNIPLSTTCILNI